MAQASWRRVLVGVLGAALLGLGGCASERSSTKVDAKWLARVPDTQLEGVREAQITQRKAEDEVTRTQVALQDAKQAREVAHRNEEAANARVKAAEASLEAARSTGQGTDIARASEALRGAQFDSTMAQAEANYRERAVTTLEALQDMRAREREVADAELALQQYLALQRSGDTHAQQLSGADFADAVTDAHRRANDTQRKVDALLQQELQARAQWQQLRDQSQAYGGGGRQDLPPPHP